MAKLAEAGEHQAGRDIDAFRQRRIEQAVVLVISGRLVLRGPLEWLAETILAPEQCLGPEQLLELAGGG